MMNLLSGASVGSSLSSAKKALATGLAAIAIPACSVWSASADAGVASTVTVPACLVSQNGTQTPLRLEIASTPSQREQGLMDRSELAADSGMLFTFDQMQAANRAFWMYRTRIPLAIAYLDGSDRIAAIVAMEPCHSDAPSGCPIYPAGVSFLSALEVNQGFFRSHHVAVGDRLEVGPDANCDGAGLSPPQDAD